MQKMKLEAENRKYLRMDVDFVVYLHTIQTLENRSIVNNEVSGKVNNEVYGEVNDKVNDKVKVDVINISKGGIAFLSEEKLSLKSLYDTEIVLSNKEKIHAVIELVYMKSKLDQEKLYGCRFIGINNLDQFKIDAYQIVCDRERLQKKNNQNNNIQK